MTATAAKRPKPPDENDKLRAGTLSLDPDEGCQPVDPPAPPDGGGGGKRRKESMAELLVRLAGEDGAEMFHDPDGGPFASVLIGGHRETWSLRTKAMRSWLSRLLYVREKRVPSSQALADATALLEGKAVHDGAERPVAVRLGRHDGAIYLDLGDASWDVARVTAAGWRVVPASESPVRFRRPRGLRPLPRPALGGSLDELRELVNVPDEQWPLVKGWLVVAVRGAGPFFVLCVQGEQGSAKSTLSKMLRRLVDPATVDLRSPPREERDLAVAATNALVLGVDNLSGVPDWLADALCRVATGGGLATRELYTDSDEVLFDITRPILLNGIDDLLTRPDLADRSLALNLPKIAPDRRRQERDLWAAFGERHPRLLGALLAAASTALRLEGETVLGNPPRMADAATWATAAEPALGMAPGDFLRAMDSAREDAVAQGLEADPLAGAVRALAGELRTWRGAASDLLPLLSAKADDEVKRGKRWPKSPSALSSRLRRLAPSLWEVGVEVESGVKLGKGRREVRIRLLEGGEGGAPGVAGGGDAEEPVHGAPPLNFSGDNAGWRGGAGGDESPDRSDLDWSDE